MFLNLVDIEYLMYLACSSGGCGIRIYIIVLNNFELINIRLLLKNRNLSLICNTKFRIYGLDLGAVWAPIKSAYMGKGSFVLGEVFGKIRG